MPEFSDRLSQSGDFQAAPAVKPAQAMSLFDYKKQSLEQAKSVAIQQGRQPTLDDYLAAFIAMGPQMQAQGIPATPQVAADLSGQTLDGFLIREERNHPLPAFYDNLNFKDAVITHSLVDPAASFNSHLKDAKEISDTRFNDHSEGHGKFELGHGAHRNITLTNFRGGEVVLHGAHVDGLHMQGQKITTLTLGRGTSITNLHAESAHIVKIDTEAGTSIAHSSFKGATISMAGRMHGIQLTAVDFSQANLQHVDMRDARLTNVTLPAKGSKGMDLTGVTLVDVRLDNGQPLRSLEQLKGLGIAFDPKHPPMVVQSGNSEPTKEVHPVKQALAGINLASLGIGGGEHVTHHDVSVTHGVGAPKHTQEPAKSDSTVNLRNYYAEMSAKHSSGGSKT